MISKVCAKFVNELTMKKKRINELKHESEMC